MVNNKIAQRAVAAGLTGLMAFGAAAPAALAAPSTAIIPRASRTIYAPVDDSEGLDYFERLAGDDRYGTMKAIVDAAFINESGSTDRYYTSRYAVVASGDNYPDALAANGLAGSLDAPVILTKSGSLSSEAKTLLEKMQVQEAIIMGGTAAVSQAVEDAIRDMGILTSRVQGADRQATSVAAMKAINGNWYDWNGAADLIIASGSNYADALSISPYAYQVGAPVILTKADGTLTDDAVKAIKDNDDISRIVILGGTAAVSDAVLGQIGTRNAKGTRAYEIARIGGADRYETSARIADWELGGLDSVALRPSAAAMFDMDWVFVATGENFPDALAGGQLAGGHPLFYQGTKAEDKTSANPILLTKDGDNRAENEIIKALSRNDTVVKANVFATREQYAQYKEGLLPATLRGLWNSEKRADGFYRGYRESNVAATTRGVFVSGTTDPLTTGTNYDVYYVGTGLDANLPWSGHDNNGEDFGVIKAGDDYHWVYSETATDGALNWIYGGQLNVLTNQGVEPIVANAAALSATNPILFSATVWSYKVGTVTRYAVKSPNTTPADRSGNTLDKDLNYMDWWFNVEYDYANKVWHLTTTGTTGFDFLGAKTAQISPTSAFYDLAYVGVANNSCDQVISDTNRTVTDSWFGIDVASIEGTTGVNDGTTSVDGARYYDYVLLGEVDNFHGYILGGKSAVSKKKAENLDDAVDSFITEFVAETDSDFYTANVTLADDLLNLNLSESYDVFDGTRVLYFDTTPSGLKGIAANAKATVLTQWWAPVATDDNGRRLYNVYSVNLDGTIDKLIAERVYDFQTV